VIYVLYTIHVVVCIFLILVVLLQQGKGADLSVFGGGSSMAAFGARGATTLLHRLTVGAFVAFVLTTIGIAYLKAHEGSTVMKRVKTKAPASAPATPAGAPAAPTGAPAPAAPASTPPPAAPAPAPN
jgi:preprotein translocase subunit SecG